MKNLLTKIELKTAGILLAMALSILALVGGHQSAPKAGAIPLPNSVTAYPNCIASGDTADCWETVNMSAGTYYAFLQNTSNATQWADLVQGVTSGTASSSYFIYSGVATATTAITPSALAYTAPGSNAPPFIIPKWTIATSTAATSTVSTDYSTANGTRTVPVPAGQYIYFLMESQSTAAAATAAPGMVESATSTNRGFNPLFIAEWHSTSTPQQ